MTRGVPTGELPDARFADGSGGQVFRLLTFQQCVQGDSGATHSENFNRALVQLAMRSEQMQLTG
ncbi:hypothetical protein OPIT5_10150 [Opitutaceae bacterium TAV5]|nr:hypothetical protein OPIT5_10150 [Opitutaceae bacterium TAV5]